MQIETRFSGDVISKDLHRQLDTSLVKSIYVVRQFKLKNIPWEIVAFQWRLNGRDVGNANDVAELVVKDLATYSDYPQI